MAGASLLSLIDDIASLLDDVSVMTKVAARKTAGVLGDDLALNAQQVTGFAAERELPVVWKVAKGSALNKVILVPSALAISATVPPLVTVLLMVGGAYLCFEGFEKVWHKLTHRKHSDAPDGDGPAAPEAAAVSAPAAIGHTAPIEELERVRVRGAVRTDFVLSAEIIVITLGTVATAPLREQFLVLLAISAIMTVGVYGLVAGIVKLDDGGLWLMRAEGDGAFARFRRALGRGVLRGAPLLMKALGILGTAAMFLVGGGIFVHNVAAFHGVLHAIEVSVAHGLVVLVETLLVGAVGVLVGAVIVCAAWLVKRMLPARARA